MIHPVQNHSDHYTFIKRDADTDSILSIIENENDLRLALLEYNDFRIENDINEKRIIINKGKNSKVELKLEDINFEKMAVKNTQLDNITIEINSLYYLEAPIEKNRVIGNVKIMLGKDTIGVLQIYNKNEIEKKDVKSYLMEFLRQIAM